MKLKITYTILVLILIFTISCKEKTLAKTDGIILTYSGDVKINTKSAKRGTIVKYGDVITTHNNSSCEIVVDKKNIFRLQANSKMIFKISKTENQIILEKGWLSGVSKTNFTSQGDFYINTPTAVAGIRGTAFCLKIESPIKTYFCVCNGIINLKTANGSTNETISSAHHAARRYIRDDDGNIKVDTNQTLDYHTDQTLEKLAKKINVTIDWSKPAGS